MTRHGPPAPEPPPDLEDMIVAMTNHLAVMASSFIAGRLSDGDGLEAALRAAREMVMSQFADYARDVVELAAAPAVQHFLGSREETTK